MDQMKVSIIIPAFNAALTIEETLHSLYRQTYQDFEIIVVNDGSTDNTAQVLAPHADAGRIRYYEKPNGGVAAARQYGLERARGELIAFQDADDLWLTPKLEKQIRRFAEKPQVGLIYTDMINFFQDGEEHNSLFQQKTPAAGFVLDRLFFGNFIATPSVVVRKSALESVGGFDANIRVNEDVDLFLRLAEQVEFDYINEVLVRRRMCRDSLIHRFPVKIHQQDLALIEYWSQRRPDLFSLDKPAVRRRKSLIHARLGEAYWQNCEFNRARPEFYRAITGGVRNRRLLLMLLSSYLPPLVHLLKRASRAIRQETSPKEFA